MSGEHEQVVAEALGVITTAGWPAKVTESGDLLVDLETRVGRFTAVLQMQQLVVELADISNSSSISRRAIDALLMALPAAVPFVTGLVMTRDGSMICAVSSRIEDMGADSIDRSLCALTVACELIGREVRALSDERLAADFIAMLNTRDRDREPEPESEQHTQEEEYPCLQQLSLISVSK